MGKTFKTSLAMLHGGGGNLKINFWHLGLRVQCMFTLRKKRKKLGGWDGCLAGCSEIVKRASPFGSILDHNITNVSDQAFVQ